MNEDAVIEVCHMCGQEFDYSCEGNEYIDHDHDNEMVYLCDGCDKEWWHKT